MTTRAFRAALLSIACLTSSPLARAQSRASAAERLFEEGRTLMKQGDAVRACEKFQASEDVDPAVGTLLNLATCAEQKGLTATAWRRYRQAAALAGRNADAEREALAKRGAASLEKRLGRVVLRVMTAEPDVPSTTIKLDGEIVPATDLGVASPVDPGTHIIQASAPGFIPWETSLTVPPGPQLLTIDVPRLAAESTAAEKREPPPVATPVTSPPPVVAPVTSSNAGGRTWTWIAGGAGIAFVAAGAFFALKSRSEWNDVTETCPAGRCPDAASVAAKLPSKNAASRDAALGTAGLALGAVAIAATVVLYYVTTPRSKAMAGVPGLLVSTLRLD